MRIVIPYRVFYSFFSSGTAQTILSVAEIYKGSGHEVILLNIGNQDSEVWWEDVKDLEKGWQITQDVKGCSETDL